ncbi:hypothetical protein ACG2LH_11460 [Zhouia sp. PK063]|uniref:hypothetical protein n=1 Tax=Zhouia sp. PK063 TaxID=3373602 RepID=UPI0037A3D0DF
MLQLITDRPLKYTILFLLIGVFGCKNEKQMNKLTEFRYSICEPLNPKIIEKGTIGKNEIISAFSSFPWKKYLEQMDKARESEIHYSPSIEIENKENKNGLAISAVGSPDNYEFYIFFKRPKMKKRFFGLSEKMDNQYVSDLRDQTKQDVLDCLNALINNDLNFLEQKFK